MALPMNYLGLPLGGKRKAKLLWDTVVERVHRRLARWQGQYLSKGGNLTLIKSALSNLLVYFMSLFRAPKSVINLLDKAIREFLWHSMEGENKFHLVDWSKACLPFDQGGLRTRSLGEVNRALLAKWLWRYGAELDALWRKVIHAKYHFHESSWFSERPRGSFGSSLWKDICLEMDVFKSGFGF